MDKDEALKVYADLMIKRIESVSGDWQKPWLTSCSAPLNIDGRYYNGANMIMLFFLSEEKGYKLPVFMTFKQAHDRSVSIKKGEKSTPIVYWNFSIKGVDGKPMTMEEYNKLTDVEKELCEVKPFMKVFNVFNIHQTNLEEVKPKLWTKLIEQYDNFIADKKSEKEVESLDTMIGKQEWICPIENKRSEKAFYSPKLNSITMPLKSQFPKDVDFYSTLLHEMTHSTAKQNGREFGFFFGDKKYGREELVAEMSSAVAGANLGISIAPREENALYLKSWLNSLKEDPKFIYSILSDVGKATDVILKEVERVEQVYSLSANNKHTLSELLENIKEEKAELQAQVHNSYNGIELSVPTEKDFVPSNKENYWIVEMNESGHGFPQYRDRIVTDKLIDEWKELNNKIKTENDGYYKLYINNIVNGKISDGKTIRMDIGSENDDTFEQLKSYLKETSQKQHHEHNPYVIKPKKKGLGF